ncbi:MAG: hypothetical protein O7A98_11650 [Acidobacteria bacterium]|nr:hypothetical protein [Acidobacteriota bacterium]
MLKKSLLASIVLGLLVAAEPAMAQGGNYRPAGGGNQLRFRVGNFEPDGESEYWDSTFFDFTGSPSSFEDAVVGIDFIHWLGPHLGLIASGNGYETDTVQTYRDFEDASGRDIRHTTRFEVASGTVGLILQFAGRKAAIQPYIGGGGGFYDWTLEERGDFIDFGSDALVIFSDTFFTDGTAFGTFFLAGVSVPVGDSWSVFAEARWDSADDELTGDFQGLGDLDLAGRQIAAGISWRF